jgi:hypothetical protein
MFSASPQPNLQNYETYGALNVGRTMGDQSMTIEVIRACRHIAGAVTFGQSVPRSSETTLALCRKLVEAGHDPAAPLEEAAE